MTGRYDNLFKCLDHVRQSGKEWPTLKVRLEGGMELRVALGRSGDAIFLDEGWSSRKSERTPLGVLKLGDAGKGAWYGAARSMAEADKAQLWALMLGFQKDPVEALDALGQKLGWCAVCGHALSAEESVNAGIGPVCRKRLGG